MSSKSKSKSKTCEICYKDRLDDTEIVREVNREGDAKIREGARVR